MLLKLLRTLGIWVTRRPRQVVLIYALAAIASVICTVTLLGFKTDQNDLVAADVEYNRRYLHLLEEFSDLEFLFVVIQVQDKPERAIDCAEAVVAELEPLVAQGHIKTIFHRVPLEAMGYGLLFQDRAALEQLVEWIRSNRELLAGLGGVDRFDRLLEFFSSAFDPEKLAEAGRDPENGVAEEQTFAEWGFRFLDIALSAMENALDGKQVSRVERAIERESGRSLLERGYLATENGKFLMVEVLPAKDTTTLELIKEPLLAVRAALDRVHAKFPDVEFGLTGRPVFQADEMMTTDSDMRRATILALAGVFLLFVIFFRRLVRPFLAILTLATAILLTFAVVSLTIGYLTLLSIVFAAMLVGLGIDFGIHLVARYQEELAHGRDVPRAIQVSLVTTGVGIGTGAFTTAAAFFTSLFIDFAGLRELGFIAGVGVLLCFLAMVTLLPALLMLVDGRASKRGGLQRMKTIMVPGLDTLASRPRIVLAVLLVLTLGALARFEAPRYNPNLLELQAKGLESVDYEMLLIEESERATWYVTFITKNLEDTETIVRKLEPLREQKIVGAIEGPFDVLPDRQEEKLAVLARGAAITNAIQIAAGSAAVDAEALAESCESLLDAVDDLQSLLAQRDDEQSRAALRMFAPLAERLDKLATRISDAGATAPAKIGPVQARWFNEFGGLLEKLRGALSSGEITIETLPELLRNRFVSKKGDQFLVYAYPYKDIWDEDHMQEFIDAMVKIDPNVTGTPVQVYESTWRMRDGFIRAGLYSLIAVFFLLIIDMRHLGRVTLAMVPLVVGLFWLVELLPFLGLEFNLANFFAVPILIGVGIDGGVHVIHRYRESEDYAEVGRTTCAAVALSLLTTMLGFGAMSFANHQGVASLGQTMVAGLVCLLLSTVLLLPALLAYFGGRKKP